MNSIDDTLMVVVHTGISPWDMTKQQTNDVEINFDTK